MLNAEVIKCYETYHNFTLIYLPQVKYSIKKQSCCLQPCFFSVDIVQEKEIVEVVR